LADGHVPGVAIDLHGSVARLTGVEVHRYVLSAARVDLHPALAGVVAGSDDERIGSCLLGEVLERDAHLVSLAGHDFRVDPHARDCHLAARVRGAARRCRGGANELDDTGPVREVMGRRQRDDRLVVVDSRGTEDADDLDPVESR
jgi:hypothetical protein